LIPCRVFHNSRLTQDLKTNKTFLLSCTVPAEFYLTGHHRRIYLIREGSCRDCGHSVHRLVRQDLSPVRQAASLSFLLDFDFFAVSLIAGRGVVSDVESGGSSGPSTRPCRSSSVIEFLCYLSNM